jgi:hypothetical protein
MSAPFLRFEDGRVQLGGKNLMVSSANLSIAPKLSEERIYGDFDQDLRGAKTEFVKFSPIGILQGKLDINFYISAETFTVNGNPNNIERMFEIKAGMSDAPINDNIVGRYKFDAAYLKNFSFSLSPYKNIIATASYDIYGTIQRYREARGRFAKSLVDFGHGLQSFGEMKISNQTAETAIGRQFEISNLKYNIVVERKVHSHIRDNEHTSVNTRPQGSTPFRITAENIQSEMTVEANEMIPNLNPYGDQQNGAIAKNLADSTITAYLYGLTGEKIAKFSSTGKIHSETMSISEGQYAKAQITIKEVIK